MPPVSCFRIISFFCLLCLTATAKAQSPAVDSLRNELGVTKDKTRKVRLALELSSRLMRINLAQALEYSNEAIELSTMVGHDSLLMASYLNQGSIYVQLGNYPKALQLFQEVLKNTQDVKLTAYANGNLGSLYYYQRDHKTALRYYLKALEDFSGSNSPATRKLLLTKANLMNNAGIIYEETRKFDSALYFYKEGLKLGQELNEQEVMANILNNYGTLYEDQDSLALADQYYRRAMTIRKRINNKIGIARSYHNLGIFFFKKLHNTDSAVYYLDQAVKLGTEIGAWQTVGSALDRLNKAYAARGMYKEAHAALERSREVNDSLFNEESTRKIAQLEMQLQFDKERALKDAAQKERELYYWMVGGGLVLLLTIVTLLFFLQRSKTRRSQLEQEHLELEKTSLRNDLAIKDKELASNIMYLINKNELINHLSEKLLEIKGSAGAETQSAIQKVIIDLQSNLQPELWQEFDYRFQQVHEQFYRILNEKFPDLTPSEKRLSAFLKLNMTTKEISAITHQNAKSIDVARTRLRKKLNLTGTDHNLVSFLSQLETAVHEQNSI